MRKREGVRDLLTDGEAKSSGKVPLDSIYIYINIFSIYTHKSSNNGRFPDSRYHWCFMDFFQRETIKGKMKSSAFGMNNQKLSKREPLKDDSWKTKEVGRL